VHALIAACPPLDRNSLYLNLLQCTHFSGTCVVADSPTAEGLAGFLSGYRIPGRSHVLFVWQVAVAPFARGQGLARRMLLELLARPECAGTTHLETTITPTNRASWALFHSLARSLHAPLQHRVLFDREIHLDGVHETEELVTIGPFAPHDVASAAQQ
jgi:L-2,4-diaminobutyric acid acetyltransferase